jgi:hypothetical protein
VHTLSTGSAQSVDEIVLLAPVTPEVEADVPGTGAPGGLEPTGLIGCGAPQAVREHTL